MATTYYATLTYYPNDGSSSWSETESGSNEQGYGYVTFSLPTLTRTGYTFNGWLFNGTLYTGSITLYATYAGNSYSVTASWTEDPVSYTITANVTFDANGGSPSSGTTLTGTSSTTDGYLSGTTPSAPSRSGYTFGGWQLGSTIRQAGTSFTVYATVAGTSYTWTAIWNPVTYTVTIRFDSDGGTPSYYPDVTGTYSSPDTYVELTMPSAPTKEGYIFQGWGTQLFMPGRDYPFTSGTYTLVAQYTINPRNGKVEVYDNGWQSAQPYIDTGNGFVKAYAYIWVNGAWEMTTG